MSEFPGLSAATARQLTRIAKVCSVADLDRATRAIYARPPAVIVLDQRRDSPRVPATAGMFRRVLGPACPRLVLIARHRVSARYRKEFDCVLRAPVRVVDVANAVKRLLPRSKTGRSGMRLTRAAARRGDIEEVVLLRDKDNRR